MQQHKIFSYLTMMILVSSLFLFSGLASADDPPDNIVSASFNVEMISGTELNVTVELDVSKITLTGRDISYTGEEISGLETLLLGAIENELSVLTLETLQEVFENAQITAQKILPDYENDKFYDEFNVNLTPSFFGLNETVSSYEFINGVLDMGANITYDLNLKAKTGWNNTFKFILSEEMSLNYTNTVNVNQQNTEITWAVHNYDGASTGRNAILSIFFTNPTSPQPKNEGVFLEFKLDSTQAKPTTFNAIINGRDIAMSNYDILPSFIDNLNYATADGFRLFVKNGLISWEEFKEKTLDAVQEKIVSTVETDVFNQTLDLIFSWDEDTTENCPIPYEIGNMDNNPAVKAIISDENIILKINDITSMAAFGLINSGATINVTPDSINFGDEIQTIGYQYNITMLMPEGISLQGQNHYTWNETITFSGDILSENPPGYSENDVYTMVEIEVETTDLNLVSFFTGNTELTFGLNIEQTKNYNVTTLPQEFSLPEKVSIDFLNSDALRVCIQENVFSQESIDNFLANDRTGFENIIKKLIPGLEISGNINENAFQESLSWNEDINQIDEEEPVKTVTRAHSSYPVKFSLGAIPPSFEIPTKTYNFTGLDKQTVTYKMIFPNGINIDVTDPLNKAEIKETGDGKKYFEITFTPDEANTNVEVSCKITPSALFLVGLFIPCILSIIITIILIIVIVIIRKKRKGRKKPTTTHYEEPVEETTTEYEDEDYYVPPPPGSK